MPNLKFSNSTKTILYDENRQPIKVRNYEIYICGGDRYESGWEIKFVSVLCTGGKDAGHKALKKVPDFDCVILFNYEVDATETDLALAANDGYFYTEH